jgi:hypothetical protein
MAAKPKPRKRAPGGGRKAEGRVKVTWYVLPLTKTRVEYLVGPEANTPGKVIDAQFGVRASKKVAGAGRKAPLGQHGRAKRSSSRAKRANDKSSDRAR